MAETKFSNEQIDTGVSTKKSNKPRRSELQKACQEFIDGWPHFLKCINFNESNLDAEAIRFFNEVPGKIKTGLEKSH